MFTSLDCFNKEETLIALELPLKLISTARKQLSSFVPSLKGSSPIFPCPSNQQAKMMLIQPTSTATPNTSINSVTPDEVKSFCSQHNIKTSFHVITRTYPDLTAAEALRAYLPPDVDGPSSYEQAGHLIHLNLLSAHIPFKHEIGQIFLDKLKNVKTVVNKSSSISNQFRVFPMEVIAGVHDTNVSLLENNCRFEFDYEQVYWNSRLQIEHKRMIDSIVSTSTSSTRVADVFCGIGPFSVPLAKNDVFVYANDLNPKSVEYLQNNFAINKINSAKFEISNIDGSDFIRSMISKDVVPHHFIMNLPALAVDFLHVFSEGDCEKLKNSIIHVYSFSRGQDPCDDVINQITEIFRTKEITIEVVNGTIVRDVAPNKRMVRVDFKISGKFVNNEPCLKCPRVE
ncbi:hypothetical protein GEMRC1_012063 [Eukaryota sp. GEM-RC1]